MHLQRMRFVDSHSAMPTQPAGQQVINPHACKRSQFPEQFLPIWSLAV
jgi:hypothetical protein